MHKSWLSQPATVVLDRVLPADRPAAKMLLEKINTKRMKRRARAKARHARKRNKATKGRSK